MKVKRLAVAAFATCLLAGTVPADDALAFLRQGRRIHAVAVPSAPDWSKVPAQGGFVRLEVPFVPAKPETKVRVAHDDGRLYVRLEMSEPNDEVFRDRERFSVWENANAEVMVQTPETRTRRAHLHLTVDVLGRTSFMEDVESTELPGTYKGTPLPAAAGVSARVERVKGGWSATFTIPASGFEGPWKANFCRQAKCPHLWSSWSLTKRFADQSGFGEIVFAKDRDNGTAYATALAKFQDERQSVFAGYKRRAYGWKWAWGAADGYRDLGGDYSKANGFGWVHPVERLTVDARFRTKPYRNSPLSDLADNGVVGAKENVFRIDLPDGAYKVHLLAGFPKNDGTYRRREFSVLADGRKVMDFSCGDGQFCLWDFPVDVKNGRLELGFRPRPLGAKPATDGYRTEAECLREGFVVNAIVLYPRADRKLAMEQLRKDELEIRLYDAASLANFERDERKDAEGGFAPSEKARRRGWAVFSRPLGENIYAGSRPRTAGEAVEKLMCRAAPGERFHLSFGLLPLRDAEASEWRVEGFPLRIREAQQCPWNVGDGRYAHVPYALEEAAYLDRDLEAGVTRNIWLTGEIPPEAKPGILRSAFVIGGHRVPIKVEVLPFNLDDVDFAWGGYHPRGYDIPGCHEDVVARACADVGMNAFVFTVFSERDCRGSFDKLAEKVRIFRESGIRNGRYVVFCKVDDREDHALMDRRIKSLPPVVVDGQLALAGRISELSRRWPESRFYYSTMDEAHCAGEPYWSEQIRLFKMVKERYPSLLTAGSESERSYRRSSRYMDVPILFEVPDFNAVTGVSEFWCYPNQAMLEGENANAGRYCTGFLPALTPVRGIVPWMLLRGRDNSTLRSDIWEMMAVSGIGGYRVVPRLVTVLGEVGITDQRYFATLRRLIAEAERNGTPARRTAAARAKRFLAGMAAGIRPSFMYYYHNGHLPASVFCTVRERLVAAILSLLDPSAAAVSEDLDFLGGSQTPNLIENVDFSRRDEQGDPVGWAPSSRGFGIKDAWSDDARQAIKAENGEIVFRGKGCIVTYIRGLKAGRVYRLRYDAVCEKGELGGTIWYQGEKGTIPNDYLPEVSNYKTQTVVPANGKWTHVEDSSFVFQDKNTGRTRFNCRKRLPGTGGAYLYFFAEGGTARIKNLALEDVTP